MTTNDPKLSTALLRGVAAVRVGVLSPEGPAELTEESDLTVGGPSGWLAILEWLAA